MAQDLARVNPGMKTTGNRWLADLVLPAAQTSGVPCMVSSLDRVSFYVPVPTFISNGEGHLVDFNLAFRVLAGDGVADAGPEAISAFLGRSIESKSRQERVNGSSFLKQGKGVLSALSRQFGSQFQIRSSAFGQVELRCSHISDENGGSPVSVFFFEIRDMDHQEEFRIAFAEMLEKQLTWEAYGRSYDRILCQMPYYRRTIARHVRLLRGERVKTVADLGAGTGNLVVRLLQAGMKVTAVDISRAMLCKLRGKLARHPQRTRCDVLEQSAEHLPQLSDASFDGVTILLALFDMAEPRKALAEAVRILRPGGLLVITEPRRSFQMQPILDYCTRHLRKTGRLRQYREDLDRITSSNRKIDPGARPSGSPLRVEVIRELLLEQGFHGVRLINSHFGNCATIVAFKPLNQGSQTNHS